MGGIEMSATEWKMHMPLPLHPPPVEMEVAGAGDYEHGEGMLIVLREDGMVVRARYEGIEAEAGLAIETLLEAIMQWNKLNGN